MKMKIKEITANVLELNEKECCRLYLEIREISRTIEWIIQNPYLSTLFEKLHQTFEGKALEYRDEFEKERKN